MKEHSDKQITKAVDGFKNYQKKNGESCNTDSIFNGVNSHGKGDSPRNLSSKFKSNYEDIFPNSFKPYWQKSINEE